MTYSFISKSGAHFIETAEGFRAKDYKDCASYPTIGYGHMVRPERDAHLSEVVGASKSLNHLKITRKEGVKLFELDIKAFVKEVGGVVPLYFSK